ncbi:DUF6906 family protein [[Clostridium] colinum]|uniref:DUF6906 family protein n=1 Tax=[Clostridium] colinum TaxID=36835 RepID=UPI002024342A|nr:hypothetical protein [[Clostridium] colinum]
MKNGRKLTERQRKFLETKKLNPKNWWLIKNTSTEMEILHKISGKLKIIKK